MARTINGIEVTGDRFAFDGCHKIYICNTADETKKMIDLEYDIYPIEDLPEIWAESCPLRFIHSADLQTTYVPQCEDARFEGFDSVKETCKRALFIETERYGYHPDQIYETYTIRQLIEHLTNMGHRIGFDSPVYLSNDGGYTYGGIRDESIEEGGFNDENVYRGDDEVWEAERNGVMFVS